MSKKSQKKITGIRGLPAKLKDRLMEKLSSADIKQLTIQSIPYIIIFYLMDKIACLYRYCIGDSFVERAWVLFLNVQMAFKNPFPSFQKNDIVIGVVSAIIIRFAVYTKGKNAKKYRHGVEYGSARWGTPKNIAPFIDPVFENNILLTQTERLTMDSRPKLPKYARNKNVIIIGGSGSGKTSFYVKPNIMQMTPMVSFVVTDPNVLIS